MSRQQYTAHVESAHQGQEIIAEVVPARPSCDGRWKRCRPVTPLVDRQDPELGRERGQDPAICQSIEAVRMKENEIWRSLERSEIQDRQSAIAPPRQGLEATSKPGFGVVGYFLAGASWPVAR